MVRLKYVGRNIDDELLIAMTLRGLPDSSESFSTYISQKDQSEITFSKFKTALRSYEENEKCRASHCEIMIIM